MNDLKKKMLSLQDFESHARGHLPRPIFGYISGGVEDNASLRANRSVFDQWAFKPRMLIDVSARSQSVQLFGERYETPFGIAPMGITALTGYRGDLALATAAAESGIAAVLSAFSLIRMEEVIQAAPRTWFQAYLPGDFSKIAALIDRVAAAGFRTLVLTIDSPVIANRENNIRTGFTTPLQPSLRLAWDGIVRPRWTVGTFLRTLVVNGMPHFENMLAERGEALISPGVLHTEAGRSKLNWSHVEEIRRQWKGNLVIKGILSVEDALIARARGADGVVLSNHGGRQLDGAVSPMEILADVVEAMGDTPVMIDSGFRRGSDVLKAVALGARMVFVGRPFNYALTAGGASGVRHAIGLLRDEVDRDMALLGVTSCGEMSPKVLLRRPLAP